MIVECEIAVEPQNIENGLHTVPDHRRLAEKAKGDKTLDILGHMGRYGGSDGVSRDLFIPQPMSWGETQFTSGELTEAVQGVRKCSFLPLLTGGEAVSPAVEIAQGEEGWLLIRWFISALWHPKPWPLGQRGTFKTAPWTHTCTCVAK